MFGPEYIPAAYLEERLTAEKAKREAEEKRQQEQAAAAATAKAQGGQPSPSSLSSVFHSQQQHTRPGSSTVLGSIYQTLAKTRTPGASTPTSSQTSRGQSPCPSEKEMSAEEKKAFDEKWREIDMV